jgi:hypothetical protein
MVGQGHRTCRLVVAGLVGLAQGPGFGHGTRARHRQRPIQTDRGRSRLVREDQELRCADAATILCSRRKRTHFMSCKKLSLLPTARASSRLRSERGCPRALLAASLPRPAHSRAVLSCSASQMGAGSLVENLVSLCVRHDERSSLRDFLELDGPDICHHRPQSPRYFLHRFADKSLIGNFDSLSF